MNTKPLIAGLLGLCLALPAFAQRERICEDEQQQAAAWIQWAAERRASCRTSAGDQTSQNACLREARQQLAQAEREHASVYSGQITSLNPGHPVINGLLVKLKDNVQAAETTINSDIEPQQIAAIRKQTCMNRR